VAGDGLAPETESVMLRNFGISLLMLGLLAAGVDGFRIRERARTGSPNTTSPSNDQVKTMVGGEWVPIPPNR
jgi:hypothetical protein